jgi:UDP-N-acetylglucosamine--N-acetylmuramyl-(pentapeptide) pyrophosphoryl-undecaprenol N-acetylglucosamine transferase
VTLKKVLIMAGGTGGHVFPALAIAKTMQQQGIEIHWLGTEKGLEARVVPEGGIPLHFITIGGLRGKGWKSLLAAPWRLTTAVWQAARIIKQLQPDVVLGFGGFVSGPGGIASTLLRKRLVIHEQNAKAGLTNKCLSIFAARILEGFPNTFLKGKKVVTTGNPVRKEMAEVSPPYERFKNRSGRLHLLVIGGSLGASAINELVSRALAKIPVNERPEVRHQTGEKHYHETLKLYAKANIHAEVTPFITNMAEAYEWADMIVARAGASTIAELCAVGVGALLIPYPYAAGDHQTNNANYMVQGGAATLIQQRDLTEEVLIEWLGQFSKSAEKRLLMAQSAFKLRKIDASEKVLKICEEICH